MSTYVNGLIFNLEKDFEIVPKRERIRVVSLSIPFNEVGMKSSSVKFGNPDDIEKLARSKMYAESKAYFGMALEEPLDETSNYSTFYPCSECSFQVKMTLTTEGYTRKALLKTWQRRLLRANGAQRTCPSCGTEHRFVFSGFKVKRLKAPVKKK